ncbi:biotin/lipoyl-containing protein [Paeniroseomonas aquatica]|uniref:biotin/lipoyl-containing protein n=1 Tax=Paeniroseomonas aquatica TaxID=373043 RepID=UPI00360B8653
MRLYAEDPAEDFRPSTGPLRQFHLPAPAADLRIESGVVQGDAITPFYDPMIAKLVAWGPDRPAALARLGAALAECRIAGIASNLGFLGRLVGHPAMLAAELDTGFALRHAAVLQPPRAAAPPLALAAAALEALLPPEAAPENPWDRRDGWRLQGAGSRLVVLAEGEALHRLRLVPAGAGWTGDLELAGRRLADGILQVVLEGVAHRVPVLRDGSAVQVSLPSGAWTLRLVDPHAPVGGEVAAQGRLAAPIPGRVVQMLVAVGEAVSRGQVLAVLEAMKTELRITAPADGVVAHVGCAAGDSVEEGAELITLVAAG